MLLFHTERQQTLFLDLFLINTKHEKTSTFWPKSWTIPFEKMPILPSFSFPSLEKCQFSGFFKPMFSLLRKACLLYKTSKIVFLRFIFKICDMGIQGVTRDYRGLQGVTRGYKGWQGVTRGYRALQWIKETFF